MPLASGPLETSASVSTLSQEGVNEGSAIVYASTTLRQLTRALTVRHVLF